jgi:hypothetical protein
MEPTILRYHHHFVMWFFSFSMYVHSNVNLLWAFVKAWHAKSTRLVIVIYADGVTIYFTLSIIEVQRNLAGFSFNFLHQMNLFVLSTTGGGGGNTWLRCILDGINARCC